MFNRNILIEQTDPELFAALEPMLIEAEQNARWMDHAITRAKERGMKIVVVEPRLSHPAAKADQCLASQAEVDKLVQMQSDAVANFEVAGTPSFLINGEMVELEGGTPLWTQVEAKLRDAIG